MSVNTPYSTDGTAPQTPGGRTDRDGRDTIQLEHSRVTFDRGPAGVIARVEHRSGRVDYAGPLRQATIRALRAVAGKTEGPG
jgi:hypothetical protein